MISIGNALDAIGLVAAATLFGSMVFFSCVMAPLIFTQLEAATAGRFVRAVFPWYYLLTGATALVAAAALAVSRWPEAALLALVAFGSWLSRQRLMPRINHHRDAMLSGDREAGRRFGRLHRLSVAINAGQLLLGLVVLLRLGVS